MFNQIFLELLVKIDVSIAEGHRNLLLSRIYLSWHSEIEFYEKKESNYKWSWSVSLSNIEIERFSLKQEQLPQPTATLISVIFQSKLRSPFIFCLGIDMCNIIKFPMLYQNLSKLSRNCLSQNSISQCRSCRLCKSKTNSSSNYFKKNCFIYDILNIFVQIT